MNEFCYRLLCGNNEAHCSTVWTAIAGVGAIGAIIISILTYRSQIEQSKTALWRSLSQEFDHDLAAARSRSGMAHHLNGRLDIEAAQGVLDFFETIAYLVLNYQLDEALAKHTFGFYFGRYYYACQAAIEEEWKRNPLVYADIRLLAVKWRDCVNRVTPAELPDFFEAESIIPQPGGK